MPIPVYKRKVQSSPTSDTILKTIPIALAGAQTVGTRKAGFVAQEAGTFQSCKFTVGTAPTGATLIGDVKKNGVTMYTTTTRRPTVAISGTVSAETATADIQSFAKGDVITFDIIQVGSTVAGADLIGSISYVAKDWS